MNSALLALVVQGLNLIPGLFAAAMAIRADLSAPDQATLDAALAKAKASAETDITQAEADLKAAGSA